MKTTIVVTEKEFGKAKPTFRDATDMDIHTAPADENQLADTVRRRGACAAIVGVDPYTGPLYDALPRGGVLARFGVGHDGIDKRRATAGGLYVTNTPGVLNDTVAEHALALILAMAKNLAIYVVANRERIWSQHVSLELQGQALAVIGCGAIGRRVARMASRGFGMRVIGYDPAPVDQDLLRREFGFAEFAADFAVAVKAARFVSLHVPAIEANRHLINGRSLSLFTPDAILVNTARGMVVDEVALYNALVEKRLAGAALDVFEAEPYAPRDPACDLRTLANVLLTPHVASNTQETCERVARLALENVRRARTGRIAELDLVNPDVARA